MRRLIPLLVITVLLTLCRTARCAIVTLDASTKIASSDSALLEPKKVISISQQTGLYIQSKSLRPQSVNIKITGLKDTHYDVYVNWGAFAIERSKNIAEFSKQPLDTSAMEKGYIIHGKSACDLAKGIFFQIPGRVIPTSLMRCVISAQPLIKNIYDGLGDCNAGDLFRAHYTLGLASDWVNSAIRADENYRSVHLFLIPEGIEPKDMEWGTKLTIKGTKETAVRSCSHLQEARVRMSELTDPLLREATIEALTPIVVSNRYYIRDGVPFVRVDIKNDCDITASGKIDIKLPRGWKAKSKESGIFSVKSGDAHSEVFRLVSASKLKAIPSTLDAIIAIKVTNGIQTAELQIQRRMHRDE